MCLGGAAWIDFWIAVDISLFFGSQSTSQSTFRSHLRRLMHPQSTWERSRRPCVDHSRHANDRIGRVSTAPMPNDRDMKSKSMCHVVLHTNSSINNRSIYRGTRSLVFGRSRRGFILRGFSGPKVCFLLFCVIIRFVFVNNSCEIIPEVRQTNLYFSTQHACRKTHEHESARLHIEARGPRQTINCITRAASDLLPPMLSMSYVREKAYNQRGCADSAHLLYI